MALDVEIRKEGQWDVVSVIGHMEESTAIYFDKLFDKVGKKVRFNFKQVINVNSCGTRDWLNFMRIFQDDREIILEECPPCVVDQINLLSSWAKGCNVQSIIGVYYCDECETELETLFTKDRNMPKSGNAPKSIMCKKCSEPMEFADEDVYFLFNK